MGRVRGGRRADTSRAWCARNRRNLRNLFHPPRRARCIDSLRAWRAPNRRNRRNRFHPPSLCRAVATRAHEALAIDDAAFVPPDPPSEATAVNLAALVGDVTKDLAQLGMVLDEWRCPFDRIAHHSRG